MKKSRMIAALLMLALLLTAEAATVGLPSKLDKDSEYSTTITVSVYTGEEKNSSGIAEAPYCVCGEMMEEWRGSHPKVCVTEHKHSVSELNSLAVLGNLPDIMMLDSKTGQAYIDKGYVLDLKEYTDGDKKTDSEKLLLDPFTQGEGVYAFPAYARSFPVIIYDKASFERAGIDETPDQWEEYQSAATLFLDGGYDGLITVGGGDEGGTALAASLLSVMLGERDYASWLADMKSRNKKAMFTDELFVNAFEQMYSTLMNGSFRDDFADCTTEKSVQSFIDERYPAILLSGSSLFGALDKIKRENKKLYDRLGFANIPGTVDNGSETSVCPVAMTYGFFINAKVKDDTEKLEACVDLCKYLTGTEYANRLKKQYGLNAFYEADEKSIQSFYADCADPTVTELATFEDTQISACPVFSQYFNIPVWGALQEETERMEKRFESKEEKLAAAIEIPAIMQDRYEKFFIDTELDRLSDKYHR